MSAAQLAKMKRSEQLFAYKQLIADAQAMLDGLSARYVQGKLCECNPRCEVDTCKHSGLTLLVLTGALEFMLAKAKREMKAKFPFRKRRDKDAPLLQDDDSRVQPDNLSRRRAAVQMNSRLAKLPNRKVANV